LVTDWRLPENRREAFQRSYSFHLKHKAHPGMVYSFLPAIAEAFGLDEDGRAWLVWLNGNTQNAVTSLMLLEVAPSAKYWQAAVAFWSDHFKRLEWDMDRRHQKGKFAEATEDWVLSGYAHKAAQGWLDAGLRGWDATWAYAKDQPHMGRLSAWSMTEYARILLGQEVPDAASFMLEDASGSRSHRNGLALIAGYDSVHWGPEVADLLGIVAHLGEVGESLLQEAIERNVGNPDVSRLTLESALCTYKSWHKPNRRYPGVYADMMYGRIRKAEARFNRKFDLLWDVRKRDLPEYLRLEDRPTDPGLAPVKQNWYLQTGQPVALHWEWPDMDDLFEQGVVHGQWGVRKDPTWT
jgi:hypothetical protein